MSLLSMVSWELPALQKSDSFLNSELRNVLRMGLK